MEQKKQNSSISTQGRSREGNLNPMYGKRQSLETKQKISDSQKKRYEIIRQKLKSENINLNELMGSTDKDARIGLLKQCFFTDTIGFKDMQQALDFVTIVSDGIDSNYLKKVINNELNSYLSTLNKHL